MSADDEPLGRVRQLEHRLEEAEETLRAIRAGEVDSLVVEGASGLKVYALEGVNHTYRVLVEGMNEGAASLSKDGTILYCNGRFAAMLEAPLSQVMGGRLQTWIPTAYHDELSALLAAGNDVESRSEIPLQTTTGTVLPAMLSVSSIDEGGHSVLCLVAIDLRASEHRYRRALENMLEGCVILGSSLNYLFVNRAYAAQAGMGPHEMIGKSMLDIFPWWAASEHVQACRRCLEQRIPQRVEAELSFADGRKGWYEMAVEPVPEGAFLRSQDISQRKHSEDALRQQATALEAAQRAAQDEKQRLETMMEVLPVGIVITDAAGSTISANAALAQTWRMPRPKPGTNEYHPFRAWWADTGKPVLLHEWASRRAMHKGETVTGQLLEIERLDGTHGFIIDSAAPIRDADGRLVGSVVANQDVTELQNELQARARITRLYAVLSRVNEAIVRCHEEHELHEQVCRILVDVGGFPLAWIGHVQGNRVVPTAVYGPHADYVRNIVVTLDGEFSKGPTGMAVRKGHPMVNRDFQSEGSMGPWREQARVHGFRSSAAFPLRRGGDIIAALTLYSREPAAFDVEHTSLLEALAADLSFAHDAMEDERLRTLAEESLARSEAKLREADDRKSQFLAVLSHELRNPLAPIKNSLHILDHVEPGSDKAKRAKDVIERQINQLARLVDDLLDVTRLTRGKLRLERKRLDVVETVRRTAEDHRPLLEGAGLTFAVQLCEEPLWMQGDAARLAQVVGNLLTNAAKFTPRGGTVVLSIAAKGGDVAQIRVRDDGMGMAADLLPRLFEPFMQAENTLDRSKGGLGLGLVLVKSVVEMHGGTVVARSEGTGLGSEFIVDLPVETTAIASAQAGPRATAAIKPRRVLVIEDHVDAAESLRDVLVLGGHDVEVAHDGPSGIARARAFVPDIVFCDIGLPGMSGYEVAAAFRSDEAIRSIFLVALTGYAQPDDLQRASLAGFDAHVAKPASPEALEKALAMPLNGSSHERPNGRQDSSATQADPTDGLASAAPGVGRATAPSTAPAMKGTRRV